MTLWFVYYVTFLHGCLRKKYSRPQVGGSRYDKNKMYEIAAENSLLGKPFEVYFEY